MSITAKNKIARSDHFEAFFKYATIGILVTNNSGEIEAINPYALKEFGYTEQELVGKKVELLIPSRLRQDHVHHRQKFHQKPQNRPVGVGLCLFALKKDGTEFPVEISLGNYHNNRDQFVIAFISNISDRKKAEAEILQLNNDLELTVQKRTKDLNKTLVQLELSNDLLEEAISFQKAILDNAGAMIIATNEKGIIRFFNPEASVNTGYAESEVINKQSPIIFHDQNEIARKRRELFKEFGLVIKDDIDVMVEKSKRDIHDEEQYTYIRKNGSTFPVLLTITAIRNNEGEITGYMGVAIDISARKKAEEDLREALNKEKELSELKSRFVSMASHEFRTPLSTVLSSAYLIEKYTSAEDQAKRKKHLQRIVSSVNMLTDILNDFLSLGRIEEGKIQVRLTRFDLYELVTSQTGEMKGILKEQQKIHYQHQGNREVVLDPSLLKHIIINLVSNASKFSPPDMPIEIRTIVDDDRVILSVKDQGMGISKEDQKHLMERFFRGVNAGNIQGTGLGLHLVSKYAELMNGTVEFTSELEKGTEFHITFNAIRN